MLPFMELMKKSLPKKHKMTSDAYEENIYFRLFYTLPFARRLSASLHADFL